MDTITLKLKVTVHFNLIFIVSFQIQCAGVQSQKNRNDITALMVYNAVLKYLDSLNALMSA